ncbi:dihydrofolate reductase family protein [Actinocrispum sp. NPDC049592]|uniref:dihydrofolate reductase family protein n=1 Tax=Actinocrispum sp. NPDC049592 TaxID=3154835 RepID=UPI00341A9DAF
MGKVQYQCAMSVDGFIAGPGGDMSWMSEYMGGGAQESELAPKVGALLIGSRTFRGDDPNKGTDQEGAYSGQYTGPSIVLTHDIPAEPVENVTFVDDLHGALAAAKAAAGDKDVSVLGADVARQLIEAGLLDEILVAITPVLLGDGVRLFDHPGGTKVRLEVIGTDGTTITLRVLK